MHPILFQFGIIKIYSYGFCVAIGIFVGFIIIQKETQRLARDVEEMSDYIFYGVIISFIGARIFYVIIYFDTFKYNFFDVFKIWQGGLIFYGSFITAFIYSFIYLRIKKMGFWETGDIVSVAVPLGQFFGRLGCTCAGCCYGKISSLPWAIVFHNTNSIAPLGISMHPTQLYSALCNFLIFIFIMSIRKKKQFEGQLLCVYVFLYGTTRFLIEIFRGDSRGYFLINSLSTSQTVSLIGVVFAVFSYAFLYSKNLKYETFE